MSVALESEAMAKAKRPEPEPEPESPQTLFAIKGLPSWYAWLQRFSDKLGTTSVGVIDEALREYAAKRRFEEMPRRLPRR